MTPFSVYRFRSRAYSRSNSRPVISKSVVSRARCSCEKKQEKKRTKNERQRHRIHLRCTPHFAQDSAHHCPTTFVTPLISCSYPLRQPAIRRPFHSSDMQRGSELDSAKSYIYYLLIPAFSEDRSFLWCKQPLHVPLTHTATRQIIRRNVRHGSYRAPCASRGHAVPLTLPPAEQRRVLLTKDSAAQMRPIFSP